MSTLRELREQVEAHLRHGVDVARFLAHFRVVQQRVYPFLYRALPPREIRGRFVALESEGPGAYLRVGDDVWRP
ncbi:MAG: hypothetical protein ACK42I_02480, partial [Thermomicrobium sp.]